MPRLAASCQLAFEFTTALERPRLIASDAPKAPVGSRAKALVAAIRSELDAPVDVAITDARTVLVSQRMRRGMRVVRVNQMFLDADDTVLHALARFVARGRKPDGRVLDEFARAKELLLEGALRPLRHDAHLGQAHDLRAIFDDVNAAYFAGHVRCEIGWGLPGRARRSGRRSITFGSFDARAKRIRIHPCLDQPEVPALCVKRVVHHEMLHAVCGDERTEAGRRVVHTKAFRKAEAEFAGAREADAWFDAHLDGLLRFKARKVAP